MGLIITEGFYGHFEKKTRKGLVLNNHVLHFLQAWAYQQNAFIVPCFKICSDA